MQESCISTVKARADQVTPRYSEIKHSSKNPGVKNIKKTKLNNIEAIGQNIWEAAQAMFAGKYITPVTVERI